MNSSDDSLSITETTPEAWAGGALLIVFIAIVYMLLPF